MASVAAFLEEMSAALEAVGLEAVEDPRERRPAEVTRVTRLFLSPALGARLFLSVAIFSLAAMAASITVSKALRRATAALAGFRPLVEGTEFDKQGAGFLK